MSTHTTPTAPTATLPALRSCSHPGCKATLAPNNQSGKCREHRSHSKSNGNGAVAAKTNGHAVAAKANGFDRHPAGGNGAHNGAQQRVVAERVKIVCADKDLVRLILDAIPAEDKAVMVAAWLSGGN